MRCAGAGAGAVYVRAESCPHSGVWQKSEVLLRVLCVGTGVRLSVGKGVGFAPVGYCVGGGATS